MQIEQKEFVYLTAQKDIDKLSCALLEIFHRYIQGCFLTIYVGQIRDGCETNIIVSSKDLGHSSQQEPNENHCSRKRIPVYVDTRLAVTLLFVNLGQYSFTNLSPVLAVYSNMLAHLSIGTHDALTGLLNRESLEDSTKKVFEHASRLSDTQIQCKNCSIIMLDIDHFKNVNDTYGHLIGDEVLLVFSQLMKKSFRDQDLIFRIGGEEFIVLIKFTGKESCENACTRFLDKVRKCRFPKVGSLTCSAGMTYFEENVPISTLMENADRALYYSKSNGRNQLNVFEDLLLNSNLQNICEVWEEVDLF